MNRRILLTGLATLPLVGCATHISSTLAPLQRRSSKRIDLTPHIHRSPTGQFPAPRPDGTMPPRRIKPLLVCQPNIGCPTPSPAPPPPYIFDYANSVVVKTYASTSYAEMYQNGTLGHQTYFSKPNSDSSLPIKIVGASQTVTATLIPAAQIPIDADFTVGSLTAHVYSASSTAHIWDAAGNITYLTYNSSANTFTMAPHSEPTFAVHLPPGWLCSLKQAAAIAYLAMEHASLDAWVDRICTDYSEACFTAYTVAEQAWEVIQQQVAQWLESQGCSS